MIQQNIFMKILMSPIKCPHEISMEMSPYLHLSSLSLLKTMIRDPSLSLNNHLL